MTMPLMRAETLLHLHIPKTGGRALHHGLRERFAPRSVFPFVLDDGVRTDGQTGARLPWRARVLVGAATVAPTLPIDRRRFVSCHTVPDWIDVDEAAVVTVLRDPVARIVSLFRHVERSPHHPLHDAARRSFGAFVATAAESPRFRDRQARQLAGPAGVGLEGQALADAALAFAAQPNVIVGHQDGLDGLLARFGVTGGLARRNQSEGPPPGDVDVERVEATLTVADRIVYEALRNPPPRPVPDVVGLGARGRWTRLDRLAHDAHRAQLAVRCLRHGGV